MSRTIEERLAEALQHKEKGNELFREGLYQRAISKYSTVFAYTRGLPGSSRGVEGVAKMAVPAGAKIAAELDTQAMELERLCEQNIAACYLKLDRPREAVAHCDRALVLDPRASKSHLRKGQALMQTKSYDAARESFKRAVSFSTEASVQATALKELTRLDAIERQELLRQKKQFSGIFDKAARAEDK